MNKKLRDFMCLFVLGAFLNTAGIALAAPGLPHQFYGTITVNGNPAPDNAVITASVDGDEYSTITRDGSYGQSPAPTFFVPDPDNDRLGETITFSIGGMAIGTQTFENAGYSLMNYDLTTTCGDGYCLGGEKCDTCADDCGECPTEPLEIRIHSPEEGMTYDSTSVPLEVSSNQEVQIWWYSLNSGGAIVFSPNTTISAEEGSNQIFVFAKTEGGAVGSNVVMDFSVELSQAECGNGIKEADEECDGSDFGIESCSSYGYDTGSLVCSSGCTIDSSSCHDETGGGHGGGNGGSNLGDYNPSQEQENTENACTPEWVCSEWSGCDDSIHTRECTDVNGCNDTTGMPPQEAPCGPEQICDLGERTCESGDVVECAGDKWIKISTCEYGCTDGVCNDQESTGDIFGSIAAFFGGLFAPGDSDSITGQSVANTSGFMLAIAVVVVIALLAIFFLRKR